MSQREFMIVLAHAHICTACRSRLLGNPSGILANRSLTPAEQETLGRLTFEDFITPDLLAHAAGSSAAELDAYRDQPVVRLRHL
jgi:hypothetical protein